MSYSESFPILYFNMAGEMLYIIDQRLTAQNVETTKSVKGKSQHRDDMCVTIVNNANKQNIDNRFNQYSFERYCSGYVQPQIGEWSIQTAQYDYVRYTSKYIPKVGPFFHNEIEWSIDEQIIRSNDNGRKISIV